MGRKSSAKSQNTPPPPAAQKRSSTKAIALILLAVFALGAVVYVNQSSEPAAMGAEAQLQPVAPPPQNLKPHKQFTLPPLDIPKDQTPRPAEVIRAAYMFAAEHPEVLSFVPCFCGCEQAGHKGNHDCFVGERATNGDVVKWDEHGVECTVCIDVATRARQMHGEGKSVVDIRAAIEQEYAGRSLSKTPTPHPH
jgi:hypothetical protein